MCPPGDPYPNQSILRVMRTYVRTWFIRVCIFESSVRVVVGLPSLSFGPPLGAIALRRALIRFQVLPTPALLGHFRFAFSDDLVYSVYRGKRTR